jgi:hypothetical protein
MHLAAQFAATAAAVEHIELNRWDLFHGHLLVTRNGHLGMLMHAHEFPLWCVPGVQLWRITPIFMDRNHGGLEHSASPEISHNNRRDRQSLSA